MNTLVLATSNVHKITELTLALAPRHCVGQSELGVSSIAETGLTFVENALIKARHACALTGHAVLADDSGLVVRALNGEPGIYSARYAGVDCSDADNIRHLLERMQKIPDTERDAYFYCVLVLMQHANDPMPLIACGKLKGIIAQAPSGDEGFGYDPVFYLPEYDKTVALLPLTIKNKISHRARALQNLLMQTQY